MDESPGPLDLSAIGSEYAKALGEALPELVGAEVTIGSASIETVGPDAVLEDIFPIALTTCGSEPDEAQRVYLFVSRKTAVTLACMRLEHPEERVKELLELPLDKEGLAAFGEVMDVAAAVLSRVFGEHRDLPGLRVESTVDVESPSDEPAWRRSKQLAIARYAIAIPGAEDGTLTIVFPARVANAWFGMELDAASHGESDEDDTSEIVPTSIVFIEPSEAARNEIDQLEEGMIHSIWTIDPEEFDPNEMEEFAEVGAFFIEWDLGYRTGLDLLECIRGSELTRHAPVVMMSSTPSASRVRTAMRSGASSFVTKPLDLEEFHIRLDPLLRARQRAMA